MKRRRHPDWLKVSIPGGDTYASLKKRLRKAKLHTICEEAKCPNIAECFRRGTATFLILGDTCTRNCRYCHVSYGAPNQINYKEPMEIAESVRELGLRYVVITSVTRDDLFDGGADQFHQTINVIKEKNPHCHVEVLIPDFKGNIDALSHVLSAKPAVLNHNTEVVKQLFPLLRPDGNYSQSLHLLSQSKKQDSTIPTKSGFMIGLGETMPQIITLLDDLNDADVDFLTIGQYLQPSSSHASVKKYYTPFEFGQLKDIAKEKGFSEVESGPLVRSSYHAEKQFNNHKKSFKREIHSGVL